MRKKGREKIGGKIERGGIGREGTEDEKVGVRGKR